MVRWMLPPGCSIMTIGAMHCSVPGWSRIICFPWAEARTRPPIIFRLAGWTRRGLWPVRTISVSRQERILTVSLPTGSIWREIWGIPMTRAIRWCRQREHMPSTRSFIPVWLLRYSRFTSATSKVIIYWTVRETRFLIMERNALSTDGPTIWLHWFMMQSGIRPIISISTSLPVRSSCATLLSKWAVVRIYWIVVIPKCITISSVMQPMSEDEAAWRLWG